MDRNRYDNGIEEESSSNIWSSYMIFYMSSMLLSFSKWSQLSSLWGLLLQHLQHNSNLTLRELWQMLWSFFLQFYVVVFSVMNVWRRYINRMKTVFLVRVSNFCQYVTPLYRHNQTDWKHQRKFAIYRLIVWMLFQPLLLFQWWCRRFSETCFLSENYI